MVDYANQPYALRSSKLYNTIRVENVMSHLKTLDNIAKAHVSGSRSVENAFNESAEYVIANLHKSTSCQIKKQYFRVPVWNQGQKDPILKLNIDGTWKDLQVNIDYRLMRYGGISASVQDKRVVQLYFDQKQCLPGTDVKNKVAIISVGENKNCSLWEMAFSAEEQGASAVIFYNDISQKSLMNTRIRIVQWKEGDPLMTIPVLSASYSVSLLLHMSDEVKVSIESFAEMNMHTTFNVICDIPSSTSDEKVMIFGAHLDSVPEGPGLVDNGSGSMSLLEVCLSIHRQRIRIRRPVRFIWWSAEELGLMGSREYVRRLSAKERSRIGVYANHDMLASPNFIPKIIRGDLQNIYASAIQNYQLIDPLSSSSDHVSFIEAGIPAVGGIQTGAGEIKSSEDRLKFKGLANAPLDPCYHKYCDDLQNISVDGLEKMLKSMAFAIEKLITDVEGVYV